MEFESSIDPVKEVKNAENEFGLKLLASTLAHEIRNPLQCIRLMLDSASRNSDKLAIEKISENLDRLESVVSRVQQLSQRYTLTPALLNLRDLVEQTISSFHFWLSAARITVRTHCQWEGEPTLYGDRELIQQVLLNLVMNAIQAMPQGGSLDILVAEENDSAVIEITDTGVGISSDAIKLVGTPFFTTKENGKGLGVAFCRTIAALHEGSLEIESQTGKGTRVTLRLSKTLSQKEERVHV